MRDRYGPFPPPVEGLFAYAALRLRAEGLGIAQIDVASGSFSLRFGADTTATPEGLIALVATLPGARLNPDGVRIPRPAGASPTLALTDILARLEQALGAPDAIIQGSTPRT